MNPVRTWEGAMNPDLKGPLLKNPGMSPKTHGHPSPRLKMLALDLKPACALCAKRLLTMPAGGVLTHFLHHLIAKAWWKASRKAQHHEWREFDGERFWMDHAANLVVLCLDCHASITSEGLDFFPDLGEEKLNAQLGRFRDWAHDLPERLGRNARFLLPQHMIWRAGEEWFKELWGEIRAWEEQHGCRMDLK